MFLRIQGLVLLVAVLTIGVVRADKDSQDDTNGQRNDGQHNGMNNTGYYNGNDNDGDYNGNNNAGSYNGNNNEGSHNGNNNGGSYNGNNNKGSGRNGNGNGNGNGRNGNGNGNGAGSTSSWQSFLNDFDFGNIGPSESDEEGWGSWKDDDDDVGSNFDWGNFGKDFDQGQNSADDDSDDGSTSVSQSISVTSDSDNSDGKSVHVSSSISVTSDGDNNQISVCLSDPNYDSQRLSCAGRGVISSVTIEYGAKQNCQLSTGNDCDYKTSTSSTESATQRCRGKESCYYTPSSPANLPADDLQADEACSATSSGRMTVVRIQYLCGEDTTERATQEPPVTTTYRASTTYHASTPYRSPATTTAEPTTTVYRPTSPPVSESSTTSGGVEEEKVGSCPADRYRRSRYSFYRPSWCLSLCDSDSSCPADLKCCGDCLKMCTKPEIEDVQPKTGVCPSYYGLRSSRRYCFKIFPDQCQADSDCPANMLCCGDCRKKCLYPAGQQPDWNRRSYTRGGRGSYYSHFSMPTLW